MLKALSAALTAMLQDESTFARAEALYAETFRSPQTFTVADGFYDRECLVQYLMEPIYKQVSAGDQSAPAYLSEEEHGLCIEPEILKAGWTEEDAERFVDHVEFVELCNYKGEGEGFELASRAKHLRVFVSKYDYHAA
ncbi:hypothetical protein H8F21_14075 [Pseudomonas sp. P66]|uniref:Uncharacterized protein n=1 Tax=Pseudomonas arcuscaelestis TaxID=2710591 RepID=A0ABS2BYK4_9PSED|nr:hypothetical protein [Pseudomonas arcuscaelestis]MBM5458692.1 hypothetical protein [Pseudomonas arcuscaelestis]